MGDFVGAALGFPAVLFSFMLAVVIGYWVLVLLGGLDGDLPDDLLSAVGLRGVPAAVTVSLMVAIAWFVSLVGVVLVDGVAARVAVLVVALLAAWACTRLLALPLRRMLPPASPSRSDFVGRMCVIRTGRVGRDFGQAEVTAEDGSTAIVQVRQTGDDDLRAGSSALIFDYDPEGEFFWVMAYEMH
ncbi:hypothetical protein Pth03_68240 [Planotetraspora thailandica]|uniref:DUF1449 domain-containing protein n=1 Tax=Planotetraspora thailandica TaxID=487172 RepID=A0A8J3Y0C0_9ACTN|nr:hypothetical protein [Planotetraspora thailandica]GII58435.1 hypothetical protein Pth03_68240 [Planotetraspora thailandica]